MYLYNVRLTVPSGPMSATSNRAEATTSTSPCHRPGPPSADCFISRCLYLRYFWTKMFFYYVFYQLTTGRLRPIDDTAYIAKYLLYIQSPLTSSSSPWHTGWIVHSAHIFLVKLFIIVVSLWEPVIMGTSKWRLWLELGKLGKLTRSP